MRNFVKGLVTNRFGIVLAALNVCYFVSKKFVPFIFSHGNEDNCIFYNHQMFFWLKTHYAEIILEINSVAILASMIPSKFMQIIFPEFCSFTQARFQIVFLIFFITLQWLFIGWAAKTIAQKIRSN
jgi:hypothetical protein